MVVSDAMPVDLYKSWITPQHASTLMSRQHGLNRVHMILTHWGPVKWVIGSVNGLVPVWCQAISLNKSNACIYTNHWTISTQQFGAWLIKARRKGSSLVQVLTWRWTGAKSLPEPMLMCHWEQTFLKFASKYNNIIFSWKCIWKISSANHWPFSILFRPGQGFYISNTHTTPITTRIVEEEGGWTYGGRAIKKLDFLYWTTQ